MWSKSEAKALKQQFWTALGQYMRPVPSAEGERIHWINYETGKKGISIKLQQTDNACCTQLAVFHPNEKLNRHWWLQLAKLKDELPKLEAGEWIWHHGEQTVTASITDVLILRQHDWPRCISFFKESLVALDGFWCTAKWLLPNEEDII